MALLAPDSEVDICNLACTHLKQADISVIDPPGTQVEVEFAKWYHQVRQATLRAHSWNFATDRVQLLPEVVAPAFGYSHKYLLPTNWIRYLGRYDDEGNKLGDGLDYDIESGYYLFNGDDDASINLKFIIDFTNISKMDALFRSLFAINLAIMLAPKFSSSEARLGSLLTIQKDLKAEATAIDGQERPPRRVQHSKFLAARRRGSSGIAGPTTVFE